MLIAALLGFFGLFSNEPIYEKISQKIVKQYQTEILKPRDIQISSIGGSSKKGIKMIHIGVATKGPGNVEDSRKLIVYLVTELVRRYNETPSMVPYLLDYPFTEKNIEFTISFRNPSATFWVKNQTQRDENQLAYVTMYRGNIDYMVVDKEGIHPFREILTESYQDALKIIQNQKTNISPNQNNTQQPKQHE